MKPEIHPELKDTKFICNCGNIINTQSIKGGKVQLEICSACHPFYAGNQKVVDTEGRIEKFNRRYQKKSV